MGEEVDGAVLVLLWVVGGFGLCFPFCEVMGLLSSSR